MIKIKNRDNFYFEGMDPLESYFHPRKLELLKKSWAEVFRNHVLPQLPVAQIAKNFNEAVQAMYSYKLLLRVFNEQCSLEHEQAVIKPAQEVRADSLQNPSDVDASYDGHKGQGYQVQVMETYARNNETDATDQQSLQLITYVAVEPAHCHDSDAIKLALEDVEQRHLVPEELEADTLYGSQQNIAKAKQHNVTLVAPTPGKKPHHNLAAFAMNPTTTEIECGPESHEPHSIKHNNKGSISCIWDKQVCQHCRLRSDCCVTASNKGYLLRYTPQQAALTMRRHYEQSAEFKDKYRYRSGIEASISRFIHQTGARRLRYRGLKRVDSAAGLKALGINIFRTAKFLVHQDNQACFA